MHCARYLKILNKISFSLKKNRIKATVKIQRKPSISDSTLDPQIFSMKSLHFHTFFYVKSVNFRTQE